METVIFQCIRSGNKVGFKLEADIAHMRKHEGYVEIITKEIQNVEKPKSNAGSGVLSAISNGNPNGSTKLRIESSESTSPKREENVINPERQRRQVLSIKGATSIKSAA